jgi:hypothetical protein
MFPLVLKPVPIGEALKLQTALKWLPLFVIKPQVL